jgi:RNA polymerase sigma-70 factor, ECF subfamily
MSLPMDTPVSLLERLRQPDDQEAWDRFVALYTPLLYHWAVRAGLQAQDAADLVQDVFIRLVRKLPEFRYDPARSFRGWLHAVLLNLWRDRRATHPDVTSPANLDGLAQADSLPSWEEAEYRRQLLSRALPIVQREFPAATWQAFVSYALEGLPVQEVAAKLQTSVNAVYLAKSRVIRRLRQEFDGLIE